MESDDENIDALRQKLEEAYAELARLSDYFAGVVNDNKKSTRLSDNKIERLQTNVKVLEGQLEVAVTEKFNCAKKLSEVEVQCEHFQRELDKLKLRHEKQETKLRILRQEIESMNERKRAIFTKFKLMKSQEKVHDIVVGTLKSKFEEKIWDFLNEDASRIDSSTFEPPNALSASTSNNPIPSSSNRGTSLVIDNEPNGAEPQSMENISDWNRCHTVGAVGGRTQVVSYNQISMRKTSGTVIKRSTLTSTSTTLHTTATKSGKTRKITEICPPPMAITERLKRPRRFLKCTFCLKPYVSNPVQAFCKCQYKENL